MKQADKQPKLIKISENEYQFEDIYGNKSEIFYFASAYKQGFSLVKRNKEDKESLYRDMIGNISTKPSFVGKQFYKFAHGFIGIDYVPIMCFLNENFCQGVKLALLDKIALQIQKRTQEGKHIDIKRVKEQKDKVIDLCSHKRELALATFHRKIKARKNSAKNNEIEKESE